MISNKLFSNFGIWANDVIVSKSSFLYFCLGLDYVPVSNLRIKDIWLDSECIVAADAHDILLFGGGFEHDDCPLFDDIVVPEDDLEILVFFLTDYGTGGIDDTSLSENYVAYNLV